MKGIDGYLHGNSKFGQLAAKYALAKVCQSAYLRVRPSVCPRVWTTPSTPYSSAEYCCITIAGHADSAGG